MKYDWRVILFVALAAATAAGRLLYPTRGSETFSLAGAYEALSHIFCGCLLGVWLASWQRLYLWLFLVVTVVEVVAFLFWR